MTIMTKHVKKTFQLSDGREVSIETGKLAKQADGSVVVRMGDAMLLATVVSAAEAKEGVDFLPLSVDYQEKFAAAGKIPGGFIKREGKLSDHEVLTSRLVDRAIRPLFPDDYHCETQVNITLISADKDASPVPLVALAASSALAVSDIPFGGPISEVKVIKKGEAFIVNPTATEEQEDVELDLIVAASSENILMVEGEMNEVSEDVMLEAMKIAHEAIKVQCQAQVELMEEVGSTTKREYTGEPQDEELKKQIHDSLYDKFYEVAKANLTNKNERKEASSKIKEEFIESLPEDHEYNMDMVGRVDSKHADNPNYIYSFLI